MTRPSSPRQLELRPDLRWSVAGALASRRRVLVLALLVVSLLLLNIKLIWTWRVLELESGALLLRQAELRQRQAAMADAAKTSLSDTQARWRADKTAALNYPWPSLFELLESRHPRDIRLLRLRADRKGGEVQLVARATRPEPLLQWVAWLKAEPEVQELLVTRMLEAAGDAEATSELQVQFRFLPSERGTP